MSKQNVFGFSTEPSQGGDFTPIIKYDARSGRIFRVDRIQGANGFENAPVDITQIFKAVVDFENIKSGWIDFPANSAPSFALVPLGKPFPERPSTRHKNGIRFLLKLNKVCGGDKPVREIAGVSKAFVSGVEATYLEYDAEKAKYPGKLPVLVLESTLPVTTGSGQQKSTNYQPHFRIDGWAPRPEDLVDLAPATNGGGAPQQTAPSTGNTVAPPPGAAAAQLKAVAGAADENDFG